MPIGVISAGDTGFVLMCSALVLLMTPGLAFFYGGLVRRKNVLSVMMQCSFVMGLITVLWVLFGYSLAFGPDHGNIIGGLGNVLLNGVGSAPSHFASTIPGGTFMLFQMMFAIITPALIIGASAERLRFAGFAVFVTLWSVLVYDPMAHWVWGGGFLQQWGVLDFAGGTVVHINAGMAALAAALVVGRRQGSERHVSPPHNLPFAVLGAGLLWFGWFGFNGGSALAANGLASNAFVVTEVAAAAAALTWALIDWIFHRRPTMLGVISGAVAGLVAITPASGFVNGTGALAIGFGASVLCYVFVTVIKPKLGYDDALDCFGIHAVGGIWGALATGLFATASVNGFDGLFYGNAHQFVTQLKGVGVAVGYSFVVSFILLKVVDKVIGLRADEESERIGLDLTDHRETAYTVLD
jgi:Amt family ammonium transporter